jgi:hypothetical protein
MVGFAVWAGARNSNGVQVLTIKANQLAELGEAASQKFADIVARDYADARNIPSARYRALAFVARSSMADGHLMGLESRSDLATYIITDLEQDEGHGRMAKQPWARDILLDKELSPTQKLWRLHLIVQSATDRSA